MAKVYVGFTLDVVHTGHLTVLQKASSLGDVTLGVLTDQAVRGHRALPIVEYEQRKRIAAGLKGVKHIIEQKEWSYAPTILKLKPDYFVHGDDWVNTEPELRESALAALTTYGGKLVETSQEADVTNATDRYLRSLQMTSSLRLSSLRRLIACNEIVRLIEAHNPMSALIAENLVGYKSNKKVMFDGFWSSSLTDSTSMGLPDIEVLDFSRRLNNINAIFDVTTKPMIYDADTGGIGEHLAINITTLQRIGVSAVIIEDKTGLKKNSLLGNDVMQSQDDIDSFSKKIKTAVGAKVDPNFMVIARIESLILEAGMKDALRRATSYINAGADGIMIHSRKQTPEEVFKFSNLFRQDFPNIPLICVPTSYNRVTEDELTKNGFNVVIYANQLLRSAYPAMYNSAKSILENGRAYEVDQSLMSIQEILNLIPGTT